ncbi:cytochrome c nitrate reductase, small subunit [Coraliomargarita akajimensis DSM 45221]|uniref:Cytochrome c nitrate reductase, small subunit n=2 Tax=Coraliomargarita TaxID=442430 RepID=D5ER82_CORAD|nr:cytochrome c nitrate reductase, small subunit [Coraliomargarita akajimensis DSM 45221]
MNHPASTPEVTPVSRRYLGMSLAGMALAVLVGSLFGLGTYTFQYGEGLSYFSKDPAACVNCHIMQPQFDSWQKASHHTAATCVDCHLPHDFIGKYISKAENGYLHSKGFTLQDFPEPIAIRDKAADILQQNCIDCHQDFLHDMLSGATTEADDVKCVHCHRTVGHGERVGMGKYESPADIYDTLQD